MELKYMNNIRAFNLWRLLIAPLMELKSGRALPFPYSENAFNRTAYGIEMH